MPGAPPGLPPGIPPDPSMGGGAPPMGPGGPPQFPSADPNAILALLTQLISGDQQQLGQAQVAAVGGAFSQIMASQPDPAAQAAASGAPPPAGPPAGPDSGFGGGY
jgi:hypothetical protein